ncbi:hypothetical protein [Rhodococcoides kyotonense]|uniref:MalT-like TPR region domain-containing protein n=1 Tax=Rhodococcoides kyotonense TaxID=398843 RepID=A0A177Y657_9NOCA|nr:hypothetical protein [Rhodococcus kyotonensis]OAK50976.1 hypothetical protein A3K89_13915 [Rhodococcus kyotonensis]
MTGAAVALRDAAWGHVPGAWPLPSARTPSERWDRAVALGGQGRYSQAAAELDALERVGRTDDALASLASSTRASWLRQVGRHADAARHDGSALARVGLPREPSSLLVLEARCDALTGLAADALGSGGFARAAMLLARSRQVLGDAESDGLWRCRLRELWVSAELAMMSGDGPAAVRHAYDARDRASDTDSLRHRVKTDLIVAAALSSAGEVRTAVDGARAVLEACSEHGLVPLAWASAMLLCGLGEVTPAQSIVAECRALLAHRGGFVAAS